MGHDDEWPNNARNAVKGSCNIYFSRLADRIEPSVLQQWLFDFGYGHKIPLALAIRESSIEYQASSIEHRDLRQASGIISTSTPPKNAVFSLEKFPLENWERRYFGMGQGNLRATPLQVANAFAIIARGGLYKPPRLFIPFVIASDPSSVAVALLLRRVEAKNLIPPVILRRSRRILTTSHSAVLWTPYGGRLPAEQRAKSHEIVSSPGLTKNSKQP